MAKRKGFRKISSKLKVKQFPSKLTLLDIISVEGIEKSRALCEQILKYHWDYYKELAYQRSQIADEIRHSLLEAAQKTFKFEKWQRAVKYKYTLDPLSVAGSFIDPGGRFNIGDINPSQFPIFPALYIAADKDTTIQELLSQKIDPKQKTSRLNPHDFALTSKESITIVSLSGSIDSIINLKEPEKLQPFVNLIKNFSIPDYLKKNAPLMGEQEPELIRTVSKLIDSLLIPNWRLSPMQFDVPYSSQIFGQLVSEAGIGGILYPSKFSGKDCLVIFPRNLEEGSFVELDDEAPAEIKFRRLDVKTWNEIQNTGK